MGRTSTPILADDVLDAAMQYFWEHGYFASSIDDLVHATGLNRAALYKNFGGKLGLFKAMLQRYRKTVTEPLIAPLAGPKAGLPDVYAMLKSVRAELRREGTLGCLLVMTASEVAPHVREVRPVVAEYFDTLRSSLKKALSRAQRMGMLSGSPSAARLAAHLTTVILGASTMARSQVEPSLVVAGVDSAIHLLRSLEIRT